jgi:dihydroorotase
VTDQADGLVLRGWAVDPGAGREGAAQVVVNGGTLERLTWLSGTDARGIGPDGTLLLPGLVDIHAHFREPGNEDAETIASGQRAAAHGGFTTVCLMPNTTPAIDDPSVLSRVAGAASASGSPVRVLVHGAVTVARQGDTLAALGELADAGVVGFSDDGSPVRSASLLRNALAYAGALGLPILDHPEDPTLTEGAEASEGYVATVLGLKGWPIAAEASSVARSIAILADVVRDVPDARLHLTHVSTGAALAHVRAAKAAGLPVTCEVTPHHLAFTDEWIAGARRWSWDALDGGAARDPWADRALVAPPYATELRVNPPLRSAVEAAACLAALADGTADAIATDHAPHAEVDKHVEFGWAANGISGIETAVGVVLAAVDARQLTLARAVELLTVGPARVLGERSRLAPGLHVGAPADLVVIDRAATWRVTADTLRSKGKNSPLLGRELRGVVRLTLAGGLVAYAE